jgi:nitrite reductase/ring-hydroxylating ferredoxin subunit
MKQEPICVGQRSDLEDTGYFCQKLPDGKEVLVFTAAGVLYAIQRRCPHEAAPLERGRVWDKMIRCGQHAFTFDLETGEGLNCPGYKIERYAVEEKDGNIFLSTERRSSFGPDAENSPAKNNKER